MKEKKLVDAVELSRIYDASADLFRKLAREQKIPHYRVSERTLRFDLEEVSAWMRKREKEQRT